MAQHNRTTLKSFFSKGQMPSEEHFADFIDSVLNILDDGFNRTEKEGLKIALIGDSKKVLSIYKKVEDPESSWSIELDKENGNLSFPDQDNNKTLTISSNARVGINASTPEHTLDVNGTIAASGRIGNYKKGLVPANGQWHTILSNLDGCQAFEIMAGVGKKGSGKYALLHAHALSTFNSKNSIKCNQAYFQSICKKIKLKWVGEQHNYGLQMKTRCNYGSDVNIQYNITELWFDPYMEQCISKEISKE